MKVLIKKSLAIAVLSGSALVVPAATSSTPVDAIAPSNRNAVVRCRLDRGTNYCKRQAATTLRYRYGINATSCRISYWSGTAYGVCY